MAGPDPTSRYAGLPVVTVVGDDGLTRVLGVPRVVPEPPVDGTYQVRPGDRLDLLAIRLEGDSTRWWTLADANPSIDPGVLEQPGRVVRLPGG